MQKVSRKCINLKILYKIEGLFEKCSTTPTERVSKKRVQKMRV